MKDQALQCLEIFAMNIFCCILVTVFCDNDLPWRQAFFKGLGSHNSPYTHSYLHVLI